MKQFSAMLYTALYDQIWLILSTPPYNQNWLLHLRYIFFLPSKKNLSSFAEIRFGKIENSNFEEILILPPPYKTYIFSFMLKRKLSSFAGIRFWEDGQWQIWRGSLIRHVKHALARYFTYMFSILLVAQYLVTPLISREHMAIHSMINKAYNMLYIQ